jgi:hypothetical protein
MWYPIDTEERFDKYGGHPFYGKTDIMYRHNKHGYRCPEFDCVADIRVISLGCSYVFGIGLKDDEVFSAIVCQQLQRNLNKSIIHWNLGVCGCSNDFIARLIYLAVPVLKPDLIMINFTHTARRDYISVTKDPVFYHPSAQSSNIAIKEICDHFRALTSLHDDRLNCFRNYKGIAAYLSERHWLFSESGNSLNPTEGASLSQLLRGHLDTLFYVGKIEKVDTARDHEHPGPNSHKKLADAYLQKIERLGWLTELNKIPRRR